MPVYFARRADGAIKIGFSVSPHTRLAGLALAPKPVLLATLCAPRGAHVIAFDRAKELELHYRFAHLRIGHSEWFRPGADLIEFVLGTRLAHGVHPRPTRGRRMPPTRRAGVPVATADDIVAELEWASGRAA